MASVKPGHFNFGCIIRLMRTIFITSLNPFVTRNILLTDVFRKLSVQPDLRLVIFCPDYKKDYFEENFTLRQAQGKRSEVIIESIQSEKISFQDIVFGYLGRSLINTRRLAIRRGEIFLKNKKVFNYIISLFLSWIGWLSIVKKAVRFLDQLTISKNKFAAFFDRYKPDLIFIPDVFHNDDVHFLAEAKHRGIRTVGMVRSWDNITNKGLFRIKPDFLVVNNEVIRDEAIQYGDMQKEKIFVGGMPQLDYYLKEKRSGREEFFRRIGFDSKKPLILFSPWGGRFIDTDWEILQILKDALANGDLPENLQFLVRIPPNDTIPMGTFIPDEHFRIEYPSRQFQKGVYRDQELDRDAMVHLADSLEYCDLVIAYMSSLNIDACAFDKPIVGIAFDGWEKKPYLQSVERFLEFDHTAKMLPTRWCPFVRSKEELIKAIKQYLGNPKLDKEGRAEFLKLQAWKMDGKSGERIADFLLTQVNQ